LGDAAFAAAGLGFAGPFAADRPGAAPAAAAGSACPGAAAFGSGIAACFGAAAFIAADFFAGDGGDSSPSIFFLPM
jgi:hypothetical protein